MKLFSSISQLRFTCNVINLIDLALHKEYIYYDLLCYHGDHHLIWTLRRCEYGFYEVLEHVTSVQMHRFKHQSPAGLHHMGTGAGSRPTCRSIFMCVRALWYRAALQVSRKRSRAKFRTVINCSWLFLTGNPLHMNWFFSLCLWLWSWCST